MILDVRLTIENVIEEVGVSLEEKILEAIDSDEVIELAREMIRIPSITGKEGTRQTQFLAERLSDLGLEPELRKVEEDRFNVVCEMKGEEDGPKLLFEGHHDTKPFDGMTIDPLGAEIRDGKLYGRGSTDMKSALAAMLIAMKVLREHQVPLKGTLVFGSEVGEEGGGGGIPLMQRDGSLECDMAVVGEPSELRVEVGNRGGWRNTIKVLGRATHSGVAQRGINAIEKMAKVILGLYDLPYLKVDDPLWGRSSMNVQRIEGGKAWGLSASVADECSVLIDSRLTARTPPEEVNRQVREMLARLEAEDPEFRIDPDTTDFAAGGRAVAISPDERIVRIAGDAVREVTGREPVVGTCPGWTIASAIIGLGHPAIILGPGNLEQAHSADEWVAVDQVVAAARIYALIALKVLTGR